MQNDKNLNQYAIFFKTLKIFKQVFFSFLTPVNELFSAHNEYFTEQEMIMRKMGAVIVL